MAKLNFARIAWRRQGTRPFRISEETASIPRIRRTRRPEAFAVLGFFIPLVGLILYLAWMKNLPLRARSVGKGALAGFITRAVLYAVIRMLCAVWVVNYINRIIEAFPVMI